MDKTPFMDLLLTLWPGSWKKHLQKLNDYIAEESAKSKRNSTSRRVTTVVTEHKFWIFIGILISAGATGRGGKSIYCNERKNIAEGKRMISAHVDYSRFMAQRRFESLKPIFHYAFVDSTKCNINIEDSYDPYFPIIQLINDFNSNRKKTVAASSVKTHDESMSAYRPRTDKTGGLPNISYIARKPEPLGVEFKVAACCKTGILLHLEVQRGKTSMPKFSEHFRE